MMTKANVRGLALVIALTTTATARAPRDFGRVLCRS